MEFKMFLLKIKEKVLVEVNNKENLFFYSIKYKPNDLNEIVNLILKRMNNKSSYKIDILNNTILIKVKSNLNNKEMYNNLLKTYFKNKEVFNTLENIKEKLLEEEREITLDLLKIINIGLNNKKSPKNRNIEKNEDSENEVKFENKKIYNLLNYDKIIPYLNLLKYEIFYKEELGIKEINKDNIKIINLNKELKNITTENKKITIENILEVIKNNKIYKNKCIDLNGESIIFDIKIKNIKELKKEITKSYKKLIIKDALSLLSTKEYEEEFEELKKSQKQSNNNELKPKVEVLLYIKSQYKLNKYNHYEIKEYKKRSLINKLFYLLKNLFNNNYIKMDRNELNNLLNNLSKLNDKKEINTDF
jgi:hypothetical protein